MSELSNVLAQFPQSPTPMGSDIPAPIAARDFLRMTLPPRELLLEPWLPAKGLTMIAGPRGLGKTHLALGVACAVARGGRFLKWQAPKPKPVLYVDGEMPAGALQERLARNVAANDPKDAANENFALLAADHCEFGLPDLATPEGQAALRPTLEPFALIVFDNLSSLCRSGRENEAESWAPMQAWALELRRAGKAVLFIHHTGKGGAQRGTSKREDVLDSVLLLKRPEDYDASQGARFIGQFDKARGFYGPDAESFEAALGADGAWAVKGVTADRDAEVREMLEQGFSADDIARDLSIHRSTVFRIKQRSQAVNGHAG
ncbi:AAA family ATPase [Candidatus Viadribacter manganicus]|uniref:AAA+ ATPase domain-containing protein n=1 Tax=Candidatus Viadribacter manganicus TaxID=1759059 RepID=A0A1B1AD34_9PROT|nr:AAA family ATPase [Candidatus Viadribacter manganicus]ANP44464.1 hypothetical protein ATE48_00270 [Candidatus Viadribacter manganicus]